MVTLTPIPDEPQRARSRSPTRPAFLDRLLPSRASPERVALPALPMLTDAEMKVFAALYMSDPHAKGAITIPWPLGPPRDDSDVTGSVERYSLYAVLTDGLLEDAGSLWEKEGEEYKGVPDILRLKLSKVRAKIYGMPVENEDDVNAFGKFMDEFARAEMLLLKARQRDKQRIRLNLRKVPQWGADADGVACRHALNKVEAKLAVKGTIRPGNKAWIAIMKGQFYLSLLKQAEKKVDEVIKYGPNAPREVEAAEGYDASLYEKTQGEQDKYYYQ